MNSIITPEPLLQEIAQIERMEPGKLCILRQGPKGPYYNLQTWEDGHNVSRYVPQNQVPLLEKAIAGYERFESLVEQYVQVMEQKSRAERASGVKKKSRPRASSWPRSRKSRS